MKLENVDLSRVPADIMSEEQLAMYEIYMSTLGNRPDLFPDSPYANASVNDGREDYKIPAEAVKEVL